MERDKTQLLLVRFAYALVIALILWRIGGLLYRVSGDLVFPYQLDPGEGHLLSQAVALAHGEPLYGPLDRYPYLIVNYPPVYVALEALGVRWLGPSFLFGRLLSLLALFGTAALIAAMVRRITGSPWPALVVAGLYPTLFCVQAWASLARVDILALFFSVAGIACLVRGGRAQWFSIPLFALGVLTKQNMLAAPIAGYAYVFLQNRGRAAAMTLAWVALVGAVGAALQAATDGWFLTHTVIANVSPLDLRLAAAGFGLFFNLHPALIALALVVLAAAAWRREPLLFFGYALLAAAVYVSVGKRGANVNYALELATALSVAAGAGLALVERLRRSAGTAAFEVGVLLLLAMQLGATGTSSTISRSADARAARDRVVSILRYAPDPALSEDVSLLLAAGRRVDLVPFPFTQMVAAGRLDQTPMVRRVADGEFSLVVLEFDPTAPGARPDKHGNWDARFGRWTDDMIRALVARYRRVDIIGPYTLWAPRPAPSPD